MTKFFLNNEQMLSRSIIAPLNSIAGKYEHSVCYKRNDLVDDVAVILPFFRVDKYLLTALKSLEQQTCKVFSLIAIDDSGEEDGASLETFKELTINSILLIKNAANYGAGVSRGLGLSYTRSRFVAFLDSDDFFFPRKIEGQLHYMIQNDLYVCSSLHIYQTTPIRDIISRRKRLLFPNRWYSSLWFHRHATPSLMIRTDIVRYVSTARRCDDHFLLNNVLLSNNLRVWTLNLYLSGEQKYLEAGKKSLTSSYVKMHCAMIDSINALYAFSRSPRNRLVLITAHLWQMLKYVYRSL